jgi:hypothetical protein
MNDSAPLVDWYCQGKSEVIVANLSHCHPGLRHAPGFPVEKSATNCLTHDTATSLLPLSLTSLFISFILLSSSILLKLFLSILRPLLPFFLSFFL